MTKNNYGIPVRVADVNLLKAFPKENEDATSGTSKIAEVINYASDGREHLQYYMIHPFLTPDTNAAGRDVRLFAMGRKTRTVFYPGILK